MAGEQNLDKSLDFRRFAGDVRRKTHRDQGLAQFLAAAGGNAAAVKRRSLSPLGNEAVAAERIKDDADQKLAIVLESDRNRIARKAVNVVGCPVERIDDPAIIGMSFAERIEALGPPLGGVFFA